MSLKVKSKLQRFAHICGYGLVTCKPMSSSEWVWWLNVQITQCSILLACFCKTRLLSPKQNSKESYKYKHHIKKIII